MKPNLGILENHLKAVSEELNKLLADEVVLYNKAKNYYWNIEGTNFSEMKRFYGQHFRVLDKIMDLIAERIKAIGFNTETRLSDYLTLTNLIEPAYTTFHNDQLKHLLASHETIINNLRRLIPLFAEKHKDLGSSYFVTRLLRAHEKLAWTVRAHLG